MRCLKQIFHKHKKLLKSIIGYVNMTLVNINIGAAVCALFQASKYSDLQADQTRVLRLPHVLSIETLITVRTTIFTDSSQTNYKSINRDITNSQPYIAF